MTFGGNSFSYLKLEEPFIQYFNRLRLAGISRLDIQDKLSQLEKYYNEMVLQQMTDKDWSWNGTSLKKLFTDWSNAYYFF